MHSWNIIRTRRPLDLLYIYIYIYHPLNMKRDECLLHYGNYDVPHINMKQVWLQPPPHSHPRDPVQPELILRVGTEERHSAATTPEANLCFTIKHI